MEASGNRLQKWDNLKFFLIFCVILGHVAELYVDSSVTSECLMLFIYSFHMPLFMFISGLFEKKNIDQKRYDKIFSYLIMFVLIKILVFGSTWLTEEERPGFSLRSTGNVAWFAFCLFAFSFITMAAKKFKPEYVLIVSVIIACIAGYDRGIGSKFCLSRVIVFFPFYYLGYLLNPKKIAEFLNKKLLKVISALIVAATVAVIIIMNDDIYFFKYVFTGANSYGKVDGLQENPYAFVARLLCYIISFVMGSCFISLCPEKFCKGIFAKLGERTLQIYILHIPVRNLYMKFINDEYNLDSLFTGRQIIVYEILVSIVIFIICALPFWKRIIDFILKIPLKKDEAASTEG